MKKGYKAPWLAALRSGEYNQHRETLHNNGPPGNINTATAFCCVGVCIRINNIELENNTTIEAAEKLGLSLHERRTLVRMNDYNKFSFPEIADWIETNIQEDA